ncbi:transcription factor 24-like [Saccoglossus kowalevskii]
MTKTRKENQHYSSTVTNNEVISGSDETIKRSKKRVNTSSAKNNGPRRRGRPTGANAARERSRVKTLRSAFLELQKTLPAVPPDTKLSKLDVLVLATTYIAHLMQTLDSDNPDNGQETEIQHRLGANGYLHPVKKWPMRSRLYVGATPSSPPSQYSSMTSQPSPSGSSDSC